jgi:hypothetical protein
MKMSNSTLILVVIIIISCQTKPINEEEIIKALLKREQTAHLTENVDLFVSEFAEGMIGVNRGEVTQHTKEEHQERISQYFKSVEFVKWEDKAEPIVKFSDDKSLAYAILQKQVIVMRNDSPQSDTTHFAWISVLRKQNDEWKVECNVSTNKPK